MSVTKEAGLAQPHTGGRLSLKHLLSCFVWLSALFAVGFQADVVIIVLYLAASFLAWAIWQRSWESFAVSIAILLLGALLIPGVSRSGPRSRAMACRNNMKQIGFALMNYYDVHGSFPPAYIADEQGHPMHSWRVLLLPYLERQDLYDAYRFDEPWNGPNNRKLAKATMEIFCCPSDGTGSPKNTSYVAVVGPGTAWPGTIGPKMADFKDDMSKTLLLVEVKGSGIHWMEPRDLDLSQMVATINAKSGQAPSSNHPSGMNIVFADGNTRFLREDISPATLRALITINGGEKVRDEDIQ